MRESIVSLVENNLPVVVLQHGRKLPIRSEEGSWEVINDPDRVNEAVEKFPQDRLPNIGVLLAPKGGSKVVVVDVDDRTRAGKLREFEVSSAGNVWISQTGKSGIHVYYYVEEPPPKRVIRAGGLPIDLLSDGFAIVPPSDTYLEPKGGGCYRWLPGHSPTDIPVTELQPIPEALLAWWNECAQKSTLETPADAGTGRATARHLLAKPIEEGTRNAALARVGGWLRLFHPPPVVLELLLVINDGRCQPPLPHKEVEAIAKSLARYAQPGVNGHPRAIIPDFVRREVHDGP